MSRRQPSPEVLARARKIKLFLMDVDGTLTDGSVNLISLPDGGGVAEMKAFNSQDGAGLKLAHIMGIRTGFITGRKSPAVTQRAHELKVEFVYLGQETKMAAFDECVQKAGVQRGRGGLHGRRSARYAGGQTCRAGSCRGQRGSGAKGGLPLHNQPEAARGTAREVVELILKAQGRWEEAVPQAHRLIPSDGQTYLPQVDVI